MVIKTIPCTFSQDRIYPGHGRTFVSRDGKPVILLNSKCESLFHQRLKPAKLTWTQVWRRANKKMKSDEATIKKKRRVFKAQRAVAGVSVEEIKKKRSEKPAARAAARDAAMREAKARGKKKGGGRRKK